MKNFTITILSLILVTMIPQGYSQDTVKAVMNEVAETSFSELERRLIKKYIGEQQQDTKTEEISGGKANKGGKSMPPG
ncbi:MAG: hypothetical protein HKN08_12190, partial [Gammaproteobacteria bacterium]|nr:hypothetical protein [Gammaproteobacteria bacterium]